MSDLLLIAGIAGQKIALHTADVQSVIEVEGVTPVPCAPPHVAGLTTLRSQVLTVIDPQMALGLGVSGNRKAGASAAVILHEGHAYALLLDCVEDVAPTRSDPAPVPAELRGNWSRMSQGAVEAGEGPLLLMDVAALIRGPDAAQAN